MRDNWPILRDLVLLGGGHAHVLVLRMWAMNPQPGVRLTLVSPDPTAPYTGMLPGHVAGHYVRADLMIDLVRLAEAAGARIILDRATGLDLGTRQVRLAGRAPLGFDVLSLDVGVGSGLPDVPGAADHAIPARPLGTFADRWQAFVQDGPASPQIVVVGAGVGGVELALAASHRLRAVGRVPRITLLERGATALPRIGTGARALLLARLQAQGIALETGAVPAGFAEDGVVLQDGRHLPSDFTMLAAGAQPQAWLADTGLHLTDGFVTVGPTLQTSDPGILAAGDCVHLSHAPRPHAGVYAVRAAPVLNANLRALASGGRLRSFHPQRDYLKLVSLGDRMALADKGGLRLQGRILWRLKDRIDRAFMAKFSDLPAMPAPALPDGAAKGLAEVLADRPLCGGCGAKLGPGTLGDALRALPPPVRADVAKGTGDDAAVLRMGDAVQVITTDHLRSLTRDTRLMARIAAHHAMGDVLAMGATPQSALAQVILPAASPAIHATMLAEVMEEAAAVFGAEGADVVGGHSTTGAELTLGFTVTGLMPPFARPLTKAGARPGDALILTRGIGSGTVLAALMARATAPGLILGEAVAACFATMTRPQSDAARLLAPVARAITDVTGFGLAGHLLEMLQASGVGATVSLAAIPLLTGAAALAAAGQASSLAPANRAATFGRVTAPATPVADLLWDPQTCGGFLAAVPADDAGALVVALRAMGHDAACIGQFTDGPPRITVTD